VVGRLAGWGDDGVLTATLVMGAVGLLAGAATAQFLHKAAFFILGFLAGASAFLAGGQQLVEAFGFSRTEADMIFAAGVPVAGLLVGLVAALADRLLVALASSLIGAALIMEAVDWRWGVLPFVPLALLGFLVQWSLSRGKRGMEAEKEDTE